MQNLWEEDHTTEVNKRPAKRRGRFAAPGADVSALRSWLLHDYIVPYCRLLAATRIFRRCYWIDDLGGLGDTRKALPAFQEVSSAAQELAAASRPIAMQWLVLQPGRNNRATDRARAESTKKKQAPHAQEPPAAQLVLPKQNGIINADWPAIAPALLDTLDQAAGVFLLNPLSTLTPPAQQEKRDVPFFTSGDLAPLYTRTAPTELCLLLFHAQVETRLLPALRTQEGAGAFTAIMHSDRWKALLLKEHSSQGLPEPSLRDAVIDLLLSAIRPHFLAAQRISFPVCAGPSLIEEAPFSLLFATRRQDSLFCMNDAICSYRRRLEEQSYQGLLNEAWFRERHHARLAAEVQALTERILRLGRTRTPRRWPELRQQLLLSSYGAALVSEYDEIIGKLLEAGEVRCEWRQRGPQTPVVGQDERRIPGNDDVLIWGEKQARRAR